MVSENASSARRPLPTRSIPHDAAAAAFPLGGIGTGNVSLGARGEFRDWELENHPRKRRHNPYSFFAIHVESADGSRLSRVLEARLTGRHDRDQGYEANRLAGLPRLDSSTMRGHYPIVDIDFADRTLPVDVSLRAFTPFVPLDLDASSLPAAVLRYTVTNPTSQPVTVTIAGSMSHTAGWIPGSRQLRARQTARWRDDGDVRGIDFGIDLPDDDLGAGTMSLTTTDTSVTAKPQWLTSFWPDGPRHFWNDFSTDGLLEPEHAATAEKRPNHLHANPRRGGDALSDDDLLELLPKRRTGSLGIVHEIAPGDSRQFEFALSWCFPLRPRAWHGHIIEHDAVEGPPERNYYATLWPTAWDAALHLHRHRDRLEHATTAFVDDLYGGTLEPDIADAVGANLSAIRSTTCFVVDSPNPALGTGPVFAAWEGSFDQDGSCEGTCTHVWSYAQSIAWLFPQLERSARRVEFLLETDEQGIQRFRTSRLFGGEGWFMAPAVDGVLGTFLRLHREWRFSGDDDFLRELWPAAVRSLEWVTRTWDADADGVLDSEMHNTYDIEFFGIEPLSNVMLLAALRAAERMADHLGEADRARDLAERAARLAASIEALMWNGEYLRQVIDDVDVERYQYGEGVLSDQLLGQFHAYLNGLGELLPREVITGALSAIVRHNFRSDLSEHESTQRTYALNDEGGLLLASWPHGGRPAIPFVYSDEVWTGIEHQVATSLVYAGLVDDALLIERTLRARHDGVARNPWNEIECGNHYARSLASWGLLQAFSGAQWDAPRSELSFDPASDGSWLFVTSTAWGRATVDGSTLTLRVDGGRLAVDRLAVRGVDVGNNVELIAGSERSFAPG